jgi:chemotaxis signal transduction protein
MAGATRGWLVDVGGRWRLAVGGHCVVEYLLSPPTHPLPRVPAHCLGVLLWQERMIPLVDLGPVLSGEPQPAGRGGLRAVVLAYEEAAGQPLRYGALAVRSAPVEVWASDEMACPLPESPALGHLARSCFEHHEETIPVLDPAALFAAVLPASTN